jgi:hypothetical protein
LYHRQSFGCFSKLWLPTDKCLINVGFLLLLPKCVVQHDFGIYVAPRECFRLPHIEKDALDCDAVVLPNINQRSSIQFYQNFDLHNVVDFYLNICNLFYII